MGRTLQNRHSLLLLLPKKRSPTAFLSQAITILKFNQQNNGDYLEPSHNEIYN
ncbi:MAG: hypothetical protein RPG89_03920 [Microcystis panniformis WG22]|nr:hypothetical protein [Microcystis panniformis WG22]